MEGTVKVPLVGTMKKKTAVAVGIGAPVLVLAIWWYRQRRAAQSGAAASTGTPGTVTDPAGNTCSAVNPVTGYCPGTAEDAAASAGTSMAGSPYDTSGLGTGLSGYYYGSGGSAAAVPPGPGNFADNAEWAQYAENYMVTNLSADANATGNALGKYLTGQPVDSTQQNLIEEAIAVAGQPPTAGAGGKPPGINTTTTGTGTGTGGSGTGTGAGGGTTPPPASTPPAKVAWVRSQWVNKTSTNVHWPKAAGADSYQVRVTYQSKLVQTHTTSGENYTITGLTPDHTYGVHVASIKAGKPWAPEASTTVKTPK